MRTHAMTLREVGADGARPNLTDRLVRDLQRAADSVSRWAWIREYERAEAIYWPRAENNKCKR